MSSNITALLSDPVYMSAYDTHHLKAVAISMIVIQTTFVGLRFLSKMIGRVPFGIDDWIMLAALVFGNGLCALSLAILGNGGIGHHLLAVAVHTPEKITLWAKCLFAVPMIWVVAVTLSRFAILLFYFRIFVPSVMRVQRIITFALIGILLATALAEIISAFLECRPFRYIWDKTIVGGTCVNINALYRYASLPGVITDLVMLLLPLSIVRQLQASLKVKIGLATTFLFGSLGLIAAIVRMVVFFKHDAVVDGTWTSPNLLIWTIAEPSLYIVAGCSLNLRPLLNRITEIAWNNKLVDRLAPSSSPSSKISTQEINNSVKLGEERTPALPLRSYPLKAQDRYLGLDDDEALVGSEAMYHAEQVSNTARSFT